MSKSGSDERIKKRLQKAFCVLADERQLSADNIMKITVSLLCEGAVLSRTAFYDHFDSYEGFLADSLHGFAGLVAEQAIAWLDGGEENIEKNCKRSELLVKDYERNMLAVFKRCEYNFTAAEDEITAVRFNSFLSERFGTDFVSENRGKLTFFYKAYTIYVRETLCDYHSKKVRKEMSYVFAIWNRLFPECKF